MKTAAFKLGLAALLTLAFGAAPLLSVIPGRDPAGFVRTPPAVVVPGPDVYYDTTTTLDGWYGIGVNFTEWDNVTVAQAGQATKLRVRARGGAADAVIGIGLYTAAGALLGSVVTPTIPASSAEAWYEATLAAPINISATTYRLAISASAAVDVRIQSTGGVGNYVAVAYGSFPPATLTSDGTLGVIFVIGLYDD